MKVDIPVSVSDWSQSIGIPEKFVKQHVTDLALLEAEKLGLDLSSIKEEAPSQDKVHEIGMPWAIDPRGCGCTECVVGEYVSEDMATDEHWLRVLDNTIFNNTRLSSSELRLKAIKFLYNV